jgi:hypothetical protein
MLTAEYVGFSVAAGITAGALMFMAYPFLERLVARRRPRPYDWHKDAPEYRYAKDRHVKIIRRGD